MSIRIQVALPLPLNKTFTYLVPAELEANARPGCRAIVPFGREILTGIIIPEEPADLPAEKLKEVIDLPDTQPLILPELLKLTHWVAQYYFCSWGEVLKAALPVGHLQRGYRVVRLNNHFSEPVNLEPQEQKLIHLLQQTGTVNVATLVRKHRIPGALSALKRLQERDFLEIQEIIPRAGIAVRYREWISLAPQIPFADLERLIAELQPRASVQARLLTVISTQPEKSWLVGDLLDQAQSSRASLNALLKNCILTIQRTVHKRYATLEALSLADDSPDFQPNADQDAAIQTITRSLDAGKFQTFLLYGVTGSGKTLVYQKAIAHVLKRGGTALLLIPEISLTPQMMGRFRKHFGERVAL
ncbi:MAG: DEAD/DEAH box helicase family protein, partial [bacterium]